MKSDVFSWDVDTDIEPILNETARLGAFIGLGPKEADTLRLLAEEMFGMTRGILIANNARDGSAGTFCMENDGLDFTLRVTVKAGITEKAREDFLSAAKNGANESEKGVLGKLRGVFERVIYASAGGTGIPPGYESLLTMNGYGFSLAHNLWSLSAYSSGLDGKTKTEEWDGLEKNILTGVADDVTVGVTSGGAELTSRKKFG